MRLYASIDISKLARFADVSEPAFISQLISFRHKGMEIQVNSAEDILLFCEYMYDCINVL
jgi:hypothetical protein